MNNLFKILDKKQYILADGATGTNLFSMGLETGDPPEPWNINHVDRIRALHQGFVDAGSDLILTNSFGGNSFRLKGISGNRKQGNFHIDLRFDNQGYCSKYRVRGPGIKSTNWILKLQLWLLFWHYWN